MSTRPSDEVIESVAETFALLSTPVRLKIISALCEGEKNVSQLLEVIDTTQPNMSQHLSTLYRAGVLGKRRDSTQIYYRLESQRVAALCSTVCAQVASEMAPQVKAKAKVQGQQAAQPKAKATPKAQAKTKPTVPVAKAAKVATARPRASSR
jgi:DNA-binding transcriptional ArsR family regulator